MSCPEEILILTRMEIKITKTIKITGIIEEMGMKTDGAEGFTQIIKMAMGITLIIKIAEGLTLIIKMAVDKTELPIITEIKGIEII